MNPTPTQSREVAVFDFDRTLIDTDVAYQFIDKSIQRSKVRRLVFGMLMPVLLPFFLLQPCRIVAMGAIMWIATFPLRGKTPRDLFRDFAPRVLQPPINGRFYEEGLNAITAHRRLGHRVLVISGSPQDLVEAMLEKKRDLPVEVIGSQIVPFLGGLIYRQYCMREGKIRLARQRGVLDDGWDYGYSDSAHDIPLLARCRHRFLVNASPRTIRKVKAALQDRVTALEWSDTFGQANPIKEKNNGHL